MTFQLHVDNPLFHIAKSSETIRAHKELKIVISYDGGSDSASKASAAGRLTVSCARSSTVAIAGSVLPNTQWVYYLKGVVADGKDAK